MGRIIRGTVRDRLFSSRGRESERERERERARGRERERIEKRGNDV